MKRNLSAGVFAAAVFAVPGFSADPWPQWRGPNRDGVAVGVKLPAAWPERLPVKWKTPVGPGYSSPVVADGRVFTMERVGDEEAIRAFDSETGKPLWRYGYSIRYRVPRNAGRHGSWPKSTTTVSEGRVYAFGISGVLTVLRAEDGSVVWRRDTGSEFNVRPTFGVAASPLVTEGLVILPVGYEEKNGGLMAFRADTGKIAWRSVRDGPSYCSPVRAELAGVEHVVSFTATRLAGVRLSDGKELWTYPFPLPWNETIVTPLIWKGMVVFAGRDKGGTRVLKPRREGDGVTIEEVWRKDAPVYMSSPVIKDDAYFAIEHRTGRLFCLRLKDGSRAWKAKRFGDYASLVLAGDRILILSSRGVLTIIEATAEEYREQASIKVSDSPTYAHLAVVGSRLYVRSLKEIICFDLSGLTEEKNRK